MSARALVEQLKTGLDAPICLTWELTYACNLQCVHCLSSSGQRDPRELSTAEAERVLDELRDLQVFYINIGGGEPMIRRDFFHLAQVEMVRSRQGRLMAAATKAGTGDQDLGARRVIRIRDRLVDSAVANQPAAHDRLTFVVGRPIDAGRRPAVGERP